MYDMIWADLGFVISSYRIVSPRAHTHKYTHTYTVCLFNQRDIYIERERECVCVCVERVESGEWRDNIDPGKKQTKRNGERERARLKIGYFD